MPEYRNFNSVDIVLKFLSASSVYQRRDVLLFFPSIRETCRRNISLGHVPVVRCYIPLQSCG